jgi:hypothetical protein
MRKKGTKNFIVNQGFVAAQEIGNARVTGRGEGQEPGVALWGKGEERREMLGRRGSSEAQSSAENSSLLSTTGPTKKKRSER